MGAHASAYLYWGIDFNDVYVEKIEKEEYDIHDQKTGKKTGKKGTESKTYYVNKHNGKKYDHDDYSLGIKEKYIHKMEQESDSKIIGVLVGEVSEQNGGSHDIDDSMLQKAKDELDKVLLTHLLTGTGLIAKVKPRLILNLYWSY